MKILLVEDSPTLRHAMRSYILAAGHEAITAETGEQALQIVENTPVEMIIMDVEMPGLDGFETTKLLREMLGDHWIPIIFVTGKADDESVEEGIEAGGDDYLIKPVSRIILNAKIRAMERIQTMRTEMEKLNHELKLLSQVDGLSQLLNRRAFTEKAVEQWRLSTRTKEPFTMVLLDIDHFKLYNDRYGHPQGDECIRQVSAVLRECVSRPGDIVARYGGEEFIAFLPNTPEAGAVHICERIRVAVENLQIKHGSSSISPFVTVSIGASTANYTTATDLDKQIEYADKALYEAKSAGRNRAVVNEFIPQSQVLVVDDCAVTLEIIEDNLKGHCKIITTTNGEEAIEVAKKEVPDLILLDVMLPGLDGYDVCSRLRDHHRTSSIPVVLISSLPKEELIERGRKVRANAALQKPIDPHRLIAKVNQYLA